MAIPRLSPQVTGIGRVLEPDRHLQRSRIGGHGVQQQQSADTAFSNSKVSRNHAGIHGGGIYNQGELDEEAEKQLADIAGAVRGIDILAATLDSLHDALLGLPVGPYGVLQPRQGAEIGKARPDALPQLLLSGALQVTRARVVDAFGRTLDLPAEKMAYPAIFQPHRVRPPSTSWNQH